MSNQPCGNTEITFNGHTGVIKTERHSNGRHLAYVDGPKGFAVIGTFANEPDFLDIQGMLIRKGII